MNQVAADSSQSLEVSAQRMEEETNSQSTNLPKNSTKPMDNSPMELLGMPSLQKKKKKKRYIQIQKNKG